MKPRNAYTLLDDAARDRIPDSIDLSGSIRTKIQKDTHPMITRFKFVVIAAAVLTLAAVLFNLTGAARSMKKLFGYVPEIGVVDQSAPVRHIPAPLSQTRDGVTVTINKIILDTSRSTVLFSVTGIPPATYPQHLPGSDPQGFQNPCDDTPYLRLPDGVRIERNGYNALSGHIEVPAYQASFMLNPVPAKVDQATLVMPCILGTERGKAPEDWEFALQFVAGTEEKPSVPVVELPTINALPADGATGSSGMAGITTSTLDDRGIRLVIDKLISLPDGDIVYGSMVWGDSVPYSAVIPDQYCLTDAKGLRIPIQQVSPYPAWIPEPGSHMVPLAFKLMAPVENPGPLTLTISSLDAQLPIKDAQFSLDTGTDPKLGQEWMLNKDIQAGGYPIRPLSVIRTQDGYDFTFQPSDELGCIDLVINGSMENAGECGPDHTLVKYPGEVPGGVLTISIYNLQVHLNGSWQASWEPTK